MAALLLAACSTNYSASDQQVIYIPTDKGVEAERVSAGSMPDEKFDIQAYLRADGPWDLDLIRRAQLAALQGKSSALEYVGSSVEGLFITGMVTVNDFGYGISPDGAKLREFCLIWQSHGQQTLGVGPLSHCRSFRLQVMVWSGKGWISADGDYRSFEYIFDGMAFPCGHYEIGCTPTPLSQKVITYDPVCVIANTYRFRSDAGREFVVVGDTSGEIYGVTASVAHVSDPMLSKKVFGRDFSTLNNREDCANFMKEALDE